MRILVTNKLPERTSVHWHGVLLPNGMDGVAGLTQPHIEPGETYAYEFTLRQHGTLMYHPHSDEMVQMALGMMGFFIIHPEQEAGPRVDRDFAIILHEWFVAPGTFTPNPTVMTDFNLFTFNSRVFPGTEPLVVRQGERVRIRLGNLSMDSHPIHLHGHAFKLTGTDGGPDPAVGAMAGDHGQRAAGHDARHRVRRRQPRRLGAALPQVPSRMNEMSHDFPNMIGVKQERGRGEGAEAPAGLHGDGREGHGRDGRDEHGRTRRTRCR